MIRLPYWVSVTFQGREGTRIDQLEGGPEFPLGLACRLCRSMFDLNSWSWQHRKSTFWRAFCGLSKQQRSGSRGEDEAKTGKKELFFVEIDHPEKLDST